MPCGWQHPNRYKLQSLRPRLRTGLNEGEPHQSGHHVLLLCSCVSGTGLRAWVWGGGGVVHRLSCLIHGQASSLLGAEQALGPL